MVSGETLWTHPNSFGGNTSILSPLLWVPDVDADGAPDLLVLTREEKQVPPHLLLPKPPAHRPGRLTPSHVLQVNGYIYSGSTGQLVGPPGSLGVDGTSGAILHVTRTGAPYVLLPCGTWPPRHPGQRPCKPAGLRSTLHLGGGGGEHLVTRKGRTHARVTTHVFYRELPLWLLSEGPLREGDREGQLAQDRPPLGGHAQCHLPPATSAQVGGSRWGP